MSWGCEFTGSKEGVIAAATAYFDKTAQSYEGKEEAKDILACKERAVALIGALLLDGSANAVQLKASGSHSQYPGGISSANFQLAVMRVSLCL